MKSMTIETLAAKTISNEPIPMRNNGMRGLAEMRPALCKFPHIGKRILKSAVGVGLCYLVYLLRGKQGIVFYSQLSVLWCMQPYIRNGMKMAVQRTIGTLVGAAYGLLVILLDLFALPLVFREDICYFFLVAVMIIPILYTTVLLKKKNASYFSTVVFLSIVVNHIGDQNPLLFVFNRVLDTMIGIVLAMLVNMCRIPRKKRKDILFISGVDDTLLDGKEELSDFSRIELNRMLGDGANFTVSTMRTSASVIDALGDIQWNLPLIIMDGAALYDMKEQRYLKTVPLDRDFVKDLRTFFVGHGMNCFVNIVIDEILVIAYQELKNEAEKKLFHDLRRSPYRNYVKADLDQAGDVVYLMAIEKKEKMDAVYDELLRLPFAGALKVLYYPSTNYPGYMYLKIYDKMATREHMAMYLRDKTGLRKTLTFGSIQGKYDIVVKNNDGNQVVRTLERVYEPYFWEREDKALRV